MIARGCYVFSLHYSKLNKVALLIQQHMQDFCKYIVLTLLLCECIFIIYLVDIFCNT